MAPARSQTAAASKTRTSTRVTNNAKKEVVPPPKQKSSTKGSNGKKTTKSAEASAKLKNPPNIGRPRKRKVDDLDETSRGKARKVERSVETKKAPTTRKSRTKAKPAAAAPPTPTVERPTQILKVFVFGSNQQGELGLGEGASAQDVKRPRLNPHLDPEKIGVVQVAAGAMHTAVLTRDNKIYTWGVNDLGALGRDTEWEGGLKDMDADDSDSDEGSLNPKESTPTPVEFKGVNPLPTFVQVAAGDNATFALAADGSLYGWGTFKVCTASPRKSFLLTGVQASDGATAFNLDLKIARRPTAIPTPEKINKIVAGSNHCLALTVSGTVLAFGNGEDYQLGRQINERTRLSPLEPHPFGLKDNFVDIGTGSNHSFAVHKNGSVYAWGCNNFCQTGIDRSNKADQTFSNILRPVTVAGLKGKGKISNVTGGKEHSVAVTESGACYSWGRIDTYAPGIDMAQLPTEGVLKNQRDQPVILKQPTKVGGIEAAFVAANSDHTIVITKEGKAYSSGFSGNHQTGQGTDDDIEKLTVIDNTAVREQKLVWAGCGGQYSVVAAAAAAS